jgi:hypothetical protein
MQTTHWKKLTNPNYLGSYSLNPGEDLTVKIIRVQKELVTGSGGEKEECIVASLENQKPLILNKTNCKTIEKLVGSPYIEDWSGKKITLYAEKVKAFGEVVDALRVRKQVADDREELTPTSNRWTGAVEALVNGKCDMNLIKRNFKLDKANEELLRKEANA